jgi:hypothetical protein
MSNEPTRGGSVRIWPWLVLALATVPSIWYVVDDESDIDPEFPRVIRPTFNAHPPAAYRFAEAGDTIDHVAVYVASAALVLSAYGLVRGDQKRVWTAALALSLAGFWHASTPGPLMNGWHGLGWRVILNPAASIPLRTGLAVSAILLAVLVVWGLRPGSWRQLRDRARRHDVAGLLTFSAVMMVVRQIGWIDFEPFGFWPRWIYVWGLLAFALALLRLVPPAPAGWRRGAVIAGLVGAWLVLDVTGRGLFWFQRPIHRLREIVPGRLYLSAMPTYEGLELAQERHHFRTILNLYPEYTPERSPFYEEELKFAREHGLNYVGNEPSDDPTGEEFIARTLEMARDSSTWPILVHCHASMDRSPAWVGLYRFAVQGWPLADVFREIEQHRGLRPKASVTLLYNRVLPRIAPERCDEDPTVALLRVCAAGTVDPAARAARHRGRELSRNERPAEGEPASRR